jgi:hypothetical protein
MMDHGRQWFIAHQTQKKAHDFGEGWMRVMVLD